jgi:hypothetical protein
MPGAPDAEAAAIVSAAALFTKVLRLFLTALLPESSWLA